MSRSSVQKYSLLAGMLLVSLVLSGCPSKPLSLSSPITPYKVEVVQGNFVSSEQVAALRPGMSRSQVRNILGTALLASVFHADRWDYVFTIQREGKTAEPRRLTIYFKNDALDRYEGDTMPSEAEFVKSLDSGRKVEKAPPLTATDKQLKDFASKENPKSRVAPAAEEPSALPGKAYPPLESAK